MQATTIQPTTTTQAKTPVEAPTSPTKAAIQPSTYKGTKLQ